MTVTVDGLPQGITLQTSGLSWSDAFTLARTGCRVQRKGWGQVCAAVRSGTQHPYLYVLLEDGSGVPWVPSMLDLFAMDWMVV